MKKIHLKILNIMDGSPSQIIIKIHGLTLLTCLVKK